MLDPSARQIYTEQLTPPQGYRLDRALATTYSLDLLSLLMAPISMTLHDYRIKGSITNDPVAVIEALHRSSDRFLIFCQKGRIAIPSHDTLLYSYLEKVVIEVQIPNSEGVFHPKTWLLRYVRDEKEAPVIYRFMCLSRNLTFDTSWDTVLVLQGFLDNRRIRGIGLNRPLGQFISSLPDYASGKVSKKSIETVRGMAEEVTKVRFEPPEDFDDIKSFIPVGIKGNMWFSFPKDFKRVLVVSPFITAEVLKRLTDSGEENVVISRPDSLDELPLRAFRSIKKNTTFYVLDDAAERPEGITEKRDDDFTVVKDFEDLSGLHAKLIITENGWRATVYTGSANVTSPAFFGKNMEFMVALSGQRSHIGINRFLGDENSKMSFMNMLVQYERDTDVSKESESRKKLEKMLEKVRDDLLDIKVLATIEEGGKDTFNLTISNSRNRLSLPPEVSGKCYPITIPESRSNDLKELLQQGKTVFREITGEALTGFFALKLSAKKSGEKVALSFVLNVPVDGMPDDRDKCILHRILSDQETFIRYLLLILGPEDQPVIGVETGGGIRGRSHGNDFLFPLFEEMVRAFSREPEKIDRISSIIEDLRDAGNLSNVLPPGFEEIWRAFKRESSR